MFGRKIKITLITFLMLIMTFISGCSINITDLGDYEASDFDIGKVLGIPESLDTVATNTLEEIVQAIEAEDKDAIKGLFSEHALEQAEDIDAQIDKLFTFYKGIMTSHDDGTNATAEGSGFNGSEDIISEVRGYYEVETSEDTYLIKFDYLVKCMTPSREGLHNISIIQKSYFEQDENYKKFGTGKAGVFVVTEE